jgi:hypothetical protein
MIEAEIDTRARAGPPGVIRTWTSTASIPLNANVFTLAMMQAPGEAPGDANGNH